jgi:hypothetical protein
MALIPQGSFEFNSMLPKSLTRRIHDMQLELITIFQNKGFR